MNISDRIISSIKGRGIHGTMMTLFMRYQSKLKYRQLDLWGRVDPQDMLGPDEIKVHATRYEPTHPSYFMKLFENIEWNFSDSVFVDFGCGKGASLIYASGMNFKKIIGVEFCEKLSGIAKENLHKHSNDMLKKPEYEVVHTDAAHYSIPAEADCFYFFNPFDDYVMNRVMHNIIRSLEIKRRKMLILYLNAVHSDIIEKHQFKKIKHLLPSEIDSYFPGGATVFLHEPGQEA